ncbi:MAG: hypothetical protein LBC95_03250 [Candidatus Nomurabacteria bacterium]|jgi:16S rRNA A1518/A1519 N6-dimethyltransferase RsmA/KsgA/DIM1 with predicted DNA glycosylase/AP lyase activity|nr:hypothetical protein [Candidatus Nomurabacteria bacterium]
MNAIELIVTVLILTFCFVVFFGAPFVPTRRRWARAALDLAKIKPTDVVVDLGSGSGTILHLAAEQSARAVGYELNPILCLWSRLATWRYGARVNVRLANFWRCDLPVETSVVYVFAVTRDAAKLERFLTEQAPKLSVKKLRVVAFGFSLPGRKPVKRSGGANLYYF